MKLDKFDIITLAAAAALVIGAGFYASSGGGAASAAATIKASQAPREDLYPKIAAARAMLDAGQVKESAESLKSILNEDPGEADAHALLGQAYSRLLEYPPAVREYRLALALNADYVDHKSPKFIGKRIKAALREAKPQIIEALRKNPSDPAARASLNDAQYLERMLAGGCD